MTELSTEEKKLFDKGSKNEMKFLVDSTKSIVSYQCY